MNIDKLIKICTELEDCIVSYPFSDDKYSKIPVLRHKSNNKWFGLIFEMENELCINLKATPVDVSILKEQYSNCIKPAWHMNKTHWIKVIVNKTNKELLTNLIKNSYSLTLNKSYSSRNKVSPQQ